MNLQELQAKSVEIVDKMDKENIAEKIADCIILLSKLANNLSIDLEESINKKINKLKERHNL